MANTRSIKDEDGKTIAVVPIAPTDGFVLTYVQVRDRFEAVNPPGAGANPGGNNRDVQYNDNGIFGGQDRFEYWEDQAVVTIGVLHTVLASVERSLLVGTSCALGANTNDAFAQGSGCVVSGDWSSTQGFGSTAAGISSHAEGTFSSASDDIAHAEGFGTVASDFAAHAEGSATTASGEASHSEGVDTQAVGDYSHAEGDETFALGNQSHVEGQRTIARGENSHAEGGASVADGICAHAEGTVTDATGDASHAEGMASVAVGDASHSEGDTTLALGGGSHAEGAGTVAVGNQSHSEGVVSVALGDISHAEGLYTIAVAEASHAQGRDSSADRTCQHAQASGQFELPGDAQFSRFVLKGRAVDDAPEILLNNGVTIDLQDDTTYRYHGFVACRDALGVVGDSCEFEFHGLCKVVSGVVLDVGVPAVVMTWNDASMAGTVCVVGVSGAALPASLDITITGAVGQILFCVATLEWVEVEVIPEPV